MRRDSVAKPALGTDTTHGRIPHLKVETNYGVLDAPVAVEVLPVSTDLKQTDGSMFRLSPKTNGVGRYLHVLPGGQLIQGSYASMIG